MNKIRVLFYTASGGKYGMGHFIRCLALAIRGGNEIEGYFYLPNTGTFSDRAPRSKIPIPENSRYIFSIKDIGKIDLVVSDIRDTSAREMKELVKIAPVISFDDCGAGVNYAHVTIYPLPTLYDVEGNLYGLRYLILNPLVTALDPLSIEQKKGVLVCFGGSDPYNLSLPVAKSLNSIGIRPLVVSGPYSRIDEEEFDGEVVKDFSHLPALINSSRVLITSFGITLFESMYLQTPVILINNTAYHNRLAEKFDVVNLGYKNKRLLSELPHLLEEALESDEILVEKSVKNKSLVDGRATQRVLEIIKKMATSSRRSCFFNHQNFYSLKRSSKATLFRCRKCGDLFNFLFNPDDDNRYDSPTYFLSEYRSLYGKTYIADRRNIERMANLRLERIEQIIGNVGKLLDVGSALGFFVYVANKRGWEAEGIELSSYAVEWSRRRLGIKVQKGSFLDVDIDSETYDAITFFYVLEHFQDLDGVIEKASIALKRGGVLAVAMPSLGGMSFRFNRAVYLKFHPDDHYIDTKPLNFKKYLKKYGFSSFYIVSTGIHPERLFSRFFSISKQIRPFSNKSDQNKSDLNGPGRKKCDFLKYLKPLYSIYSLFAEKLRLGDTFEIYAVKK